MMMMKRKAATIADVDDGERVSDLSQFGACL